MPVKYSRAPSGCNFCKRNKEPESVYTGHQLRDKDGQVVCPQLFKYRCEICGSTGKEAHTRSYCPQLKSFKAGGSGAAPSGHPGRPPFDEGPASSVAGSLDKHSSQGSPESHLDGISLGHSRVFRNMGSVTNSRYNSAGRLRHSSQQQQQQHFQRRLHYAAPTGPLSSAFVGQHQQQGTAGAAAATLQQQQQQDLVAHRLPFPRRQ